MGITTIKGIIFDMDNTLLQSNIDFAAMKYEIYDYLVKEAILQNGIPLDAHTCATVIALAQQTGMAPDQENQMWKIAEKHELKGMKGAGLEPGACELLERLKKDRYTLTLLTNNAQFAAEKALNDTGIIGYFDFIVGREKMKALKPSSAGVECIVAAYPDIPLDNWIFIGDSWIDGKAAQTAGIPFVCYRGDLELLARKRVTPKAKIDHLLEVIELIE